MSLPFDVTKKEIEEFCRRHSVSRFSLFGSILRKDFRADSDVDILVEFEAGHCPGFLGLAHMENELSQMLGGRKVDLRTPGELSRYFKDEILSTAKVQYADS